MGDSEAWHAVVNRDPAAEGQFVYAVTTTGIFCRPTCASRRPLRKNVKFFATPEEAQTAGFRACKRCRPTEVSSAQRLVSRVQEILEVAETPPTLAQLAAATGASQFHLQRVFKRATGLSPKQYSSALRDDRVRAALKQGKSVTTSLYEAGFGSSQAFYSEASKKLGMTPGAYQRGGEGVAICYDWFATEYGKLFIAATERGLVGVAFGEASDQLKLLRREFPRATVERDRKALDEVREKIMQYLQESSDLLDLGLDLSGSSFQLEVWKALREIPPGETKSYGEVAAMIGRPGAARAVARACATNPVALAVPCHRVVLASGAVGGYRWGHDRKRKLLEAEREGALARAHSDPS